MFGKSVRREFMLAFAILLSLVLISYSSAAVGVKTDWEPKRPTPNDDVTVTSTLNVTTGISRVVLSYVTFEKPPTEGWEVDADWHNVTMKSVDGGKYEGVIPKQRDDIAVKFIVTVYDLEGEIVAVDPQLGPGWAVGAGYGYTSRATFFEKYGLWLGVGVGVVIVLIVAGVAVRRR